MQKVFEKAQAGLIEGKTISTNFRLAQLESIFTALQKNSQDLLDALHRDGAPSSIRTRHSAELTAVLNHVKTIFHDIGKPGPLPLFTSDATYRVPAGVVLIHGSTAHPFASLLIPLAQNIKDGNAVVTVCPSAMQAFAGSLAESLKTAGFDMGACSFLTASQFDFNLMANSTRFAAAIGPDVVSDLLYNIPADRYLIYPIGPCPVLIDQTVLVGRQDYAPAFAHESDTLQISKIPAAVKTIAEIMASACKQLGTLSKQDAIWQTSTSPAYLLVHEAIMPIFMRALSEQLKALKCAFTARLQNVDGAQAVLAGNLDEGLPVFSVTSLDYAIDLVQDDLPKHHTAYVFADHTFATYAARQLRTTSQIIVNDVPALALALGPFAHPEAFANLNAKCVTYNSKPQHEAAPLAEADNVILHPFKRSRGFRIDFFMSGVFLSLGTIASILLASSGYGLYLFTLRAFSWYRQRI